MPKPGEKLLFLPADQLKFVCTCSTQSRGKEVFKEPANESQVLPKAPKAEVWGGGGPAGGRAAAAGAAALELSWS